MDEGARFPSKGKFNIYVHLDVEHSDHHIYFNTHLTIRYNM